MVPDDDSMLAQGTVDFRNEERRHAHGRETSQRREVSWYELEVLIGPCDHDEAVQAMLDLGAWANERGGAVAMWRLAQDPALSPVGEDWPSAEKVAP